MWSDLNNALVGVKFVELVDTTDSKAQDSYHWN